MEYCSDFSFYKSCVYGKIKKTPYKNLAERSFLFIDYIYIDNTKLLLLANYNRFYYMIIFFNDNTQLSKIIYIVKNSGIFFKF